MRPATYWQEHSSAITNRMLSLLFRKHWMILLTTILLADQPEPAQPGYWVNDPTNENNTERTRELIYWWYNLMLTQGYSIRERMVMFWHNHYVSEVSKVGLAQRMYWQNKLFRDFAMGNIIDLTKAITLDPAMLIYLDGSQKQKRCTERKLCTRANGAFYAWNWKLH